MATYQRAATAASYELDVTDQGFRFPQTWRSNIGLVVTQGYNVAAL